MTKDREPWKDKTHVLPYVEVQPWLLDKATGSASGSFVESSRVKPDVALVAKHAKKPLAGSQEQPYLPVYQDHEQRAVESLPEDVEDDAWMENPWADESYYGSAAPVAGSLPFESGALDGFVNENGGF